VAASRVPQQGDVYSIDDDPGSIQKEKNKHFFVVITPEAINALAISMAVPVISTEAFAENMGLTVPISGQSTLSLAVCNQVRSFDVQNRVQMGQARYVESLDKELMAEIINRVISVIDPAE